ncbi:cobyrinate a,c-diamide synthase [Thermotalea metallivorans]|uniref:Cobyrinate a,c-diamide synthase n=1 Tax=Thermotalea metallivorans TaxID=520762 RepID=A0A140LEE5_9FIRM|nr:cobyrinate a,c-diamide synthase [Thermotalea metallivorans]KXG78920.1 Cobyrinate a,c-diamide synthase [Thermotalea metallivorans]
MTNHECKEMMPMGYPRLVLAGTQSGVGKTTISIGMMAAFHRRGLQVQPFKVGPDYIDPAFHTFVTGNKSRNLDSWMLEEETVRGLFAKNAMGKDISIVEGVMGLYDGIGSHGGEGSTAHVAKIIEAPVILIINGSGMAASAAAQVLGYQMYDPDVKISGIIVNNVSGEKHYRLLKEAIERDGKVKCLGYMKKNSGIVLQSRHLGLIPSGEVEDLKDKIDQIRSMVEETIDLDRLLEIAKKTEPMAHRFAEKTSLGEKINLGVAYDKAFHFYYEDNLDLLRSLGANLVFFSPLKDQRLPEDLHGLYFGGGFPEVFGKELAKNVPLRREIREKIQGGIPAYAECGGLMYLTRAIRDMEGQRHEMVGIFDTEARMTERLQRFGYVNITIHGPCVLSKTRTKAKAHEFHRSTLPENLSQEYVYTVEKARNGEKEAIWQCGLKRYNTLAAYAHIHFYCNRQLAENFIENCRIYKNGGREKV